MHNPKGPRTIRGPLSFSAGLQLLPLQARGTYVALFDMAKALDVFRHLGHFQGMGVGLAVQTFDGLLDVLAGSRLARIVVVHANHPAELDDSVADALRRLAALLSLLWRS